MIKAISSPGLLEKTKEEEKISQSQDPASTVGCPRVSSVTPNTKGYFTVAGSLVLPAPASLVYEILGDHSSTARVFRNVVDCQRSEDGKSLTQMCKWTFLAFSGSFSLKLAVDKDPAQKCITFTILDSSFMKGFEGRWHVSRLEGDEQGETCLVEHELSMKPLVPVPPPISYYTKSVLEKEVATVLTDLQMEVQRQMEQLLPPQETQ